VKLNFEFFAKRRSLATFCLAKKFGEINPKWQKIKNDKLSSTFLLLCV